MNAVLFYSNTGESRRVAEMLVQKTGYPLVDITRLIEFEFENAVLVFPVYCQSIPTAVKSVLSRITVTNLVVVATYGRMCHGNVLQEVQKRYRHNIVAAAYVPTKHSYLSESSFDAADGLDCIANKLESPSPVKIPRSYKNVFSGVFNGLRSRMGVKLYKTDRCNGCGVCNTVCDNAAIINGKPNRKCIRCLKCVNHCPQNALEFSLRLPMRLYLKKNKKDELIVYI